MSLLIILVLALSSNLDNVGVGLAYGTRKICLPFLSNLLIAVITSCGTLITMMLGKELAASYLSSTLANLLGAGIIIIAGFYVLIQSFWKTAPVVHDSLESASARQHEGVRGGRLHWLRELVRLTRDPVLVDRDYSGCIEIGEALVLGLALTLNNLANGFAAGVLGLNLIITTGAVFAFSLLTFWVGIWFGLRFTARMLGDWASPAAGILLIAIGIYEMLH
jgi:putative sporulation protein YtaF